MREIGQKAEIDTHNGILKGAVSRVDPAVLAGTVTVDVKLELDGPRPGGLRPDLSVDGTITLEKLDNVLYVGRPAFGQEKSTVGMFKIDADGKTATRTPVEMGRSSVNTIEIIRGLKEGDQVILSDMSQWDNVDRIRLIGALRAFFADQPVRIDWKAIEETADDRLIVSLAMLCPFEAAEKQILLEAPSPSERARVMIWKSCPKKL